MISYKINVLKQALFNECFLHEQLGWLAVQYPSAAIYVARLSVEMLRFFVCLRGDHHHLITATTHVLSPETHGVRIISFASMILGDINEIHQRQGILEDAVMHDAYGYAALLEDIAVSGLHAQRELLVGGVVAKGLGKCTVFGGHMADDHGKSPGCTTSVDAAMLTFIIGYGAVVGNGEG